MSRLTVWDADANAQVLVTEDPDLLRGDKTSFVPRGT